MHAPFLMSSVRSLRTLWSLVCAKGGSGGVPGKKCRDQQSPLGAPEGNEGTDEGCDGKRVSDEQQK